MSIQGNFINWDTGEVIENGWITTQEEIEERKSKKLRRKKAKDYFDNLVAKTTHDKLVNGMKKNFTMLLYNVNEALDFGIPPADITRLIYLSTYSSFSDNRLEFPNSTVITKPFLSDIMMLGSDAFYNFYNTMLEKNLLIKNDDGSYCLTKKYFCKGKLSDSQLKKNRMQIYEKSVRYLYMRSKPREHKFLSYLFQAIPYVNISNNIICHNPTEPNVKCVRPMNIEEYCSRVGYGTANARRLKCKLAKLSLNGKPVFNFVKNADGKFIFVNPKVYYGGNKWDSVSVMGGFATWTELESELTKSSIGLQNDMRK